MHKLSAIAASSLSGPAGSYIYSIAPSAIGTFSAISSDDSLRLFDTATLSHVSLVVDKTHDGGVTSLRTYGNGSQPLLATGGRDGKLKLWDPRASTSSPAVSMRTDGGAPVLSIACSPETNSVAAGTELVSSLATVVFWDIRSPTKHRLQYVDSHNDDITELQYHPSQANVLLSGSTDGLVNVYNTNIHDEDDALVQVINHGSVHHAGFLSKDALYALSHDETFSIHPATDPDDESKIDPEPVRFGDLRQPLDCEYVVQLYLGSQQPYIAAGNKSEKRLDLVPLVSDSMWKFDCESLWRLPGAHGEEVVRSVIIDEPTKTVFTGGEDGFIRAWKGSADEMLPKRKKREDDDVSGKKRKRKTSRFNPY